jgi:hypothetical protein
MERYKRVPLRLSVRMGGPGYVGVLKIDHISVGKAQERIQR